MNQPGRPAAGPGRKAPTCETPLPAPVLKVVKAGGQWLIAQDLTGTGG